MKVILIAATILAVANAAAVYRPQPETLVADPTQKPRVSITVNINPEALESNLVTIEGLPKPPAPIETVSVADSGVEVVDSTPDVEEIITEIVNVVDNVPEVVNVVETVFDVPESIILPAPAVLPAPAKPEVVIPDIPSGIVLPAPAVPEVVITDIPSGIVLPAPAIPEVVISDFPTPEEVSPVVVEDTNATSEPDNNPSTVNNYFYNIFMNFLAGGDPSGSSPGPMFNPFPMAGPALGPMFGAPR